jgi:hypothetical protein
MAPIHFPPCPCLLPLPGWLLAHIHAIPFLAGYPFPLPVLVIFPLIVSFLIVLYLLIGSPPCNLCFFPLYQYHPNIPWTPHHCIGPWHHHPLTLTISSINDSVSYYPYHAVGLWLSSPLPLPYHWSLTHSLSTYLFLYYYLQSGLCLFSLHIQWLKKCLNVYAFSCICFSVSQGVRIWLSCRDMFCSSASQLHFGSL